MAKLPLEISGLNISIDHLIPGGQGIATTPELAQAEVTSLSDSAKAIIAPGKKAFFWNALPGEIVTDFKITKSKSHYFEAIAIKIKQPSAHRVVPKDSCFLATSPWQIMDYDYELEQKHALLVEQFAQQGIKISPASVQTDKNDYFYRNKMEYSLYWDITESKIKLAQHERGSHRKVPLTTSSIERPEIFQAASKIIDDLNARGEEARKYQSLLLRADQSGHVEGGLYENKKPHPVFNNLTDKILGQQYSYSPNGFFQINLPVYEMALQKIKQEISSKNVLDLYSGVGTIGLSVARDKNLTLVECNRFAYSELEKNAAGIGRTVLSNSEDALEYIEPDQTVIVDPPRAGCDKKLIDKFLEVLPETIIYLSCNPATQARDVKLLIKKYEISSVTPFNFFPRTPHLENLVILKKR